MNELGGRSSRPGATLGVLLLVLPAGCQCSAAYGGVTVPETIDQLFTRNGFVYATGAFRPKPNTRGDASFTVVDAEALCLKKQTVIHPTRDVARAQYREWTFGAVGPHLLGTTSSSLLGVYASAGSKPMQLVRHDLKDPFDPVEAERRDLAGTESGAIAASAALTDDVVFFGVSVLTPGANPANLVVLVKLSTLEHKVAAAPAGGVPSQTAVDAPRGLVYWLTSDGAPTPQQVLLAMRFDATALTMTEASRTTVPGLTFPRALVVLPDGTLAVSDGGLTGKPPALHLFSLDADGRATPTRTVEVGGATALSRLAVANGRLLAAQDKDVLTFDLALGGTSAAPLARLAVPAAPRAFVPFSSASEPTASFLALPLGNEGLVLVEVGTATLLARKGFAHSWNTGAIDARTFTTY